MSSKGVAALLRATDSSSRAAPLLPEGGGKGGGEKGRGGGVGERGASCAAGQALATAYVVADVRRHKSSFLVGVFVVFLVVFFCALLLNSTSKSPVIFFKLAENSVGELDVVYSPGVQIEGRTVPAEDGVLAAEVRAGSGSGSGGGDDADNGGVGSADDALSGIQLVNHTLFSESTAGLRSVTGIAPRWALPALVSLPYDPLNNSSAVALGLEFELEDEIGIGREWTLPPLQNATAYVSRSALKQIGIDTATAAGRLLRVAVDVAELASAVGVLEDGDAAGASGVALYTELARVLVPGAADAWDDEVTVDAAEALLGGSAPLLNDTGGGTFDGGEVADEIEAALRPFGVDVDFPDSVRNARNATELERAAREYLAGLPANQTQVTATVGELVEGALQAYAGSTLGISPVIETVVEISAVMGSPDGKWPTSLGNVVLMDAGFLWRTVTDGAAGLLGGLAAALDPLLGGDTGTVPVTLPGTGTVIQVDVGAALSGAGAGDLDSIRNATGGLNATELARAVEDLRKEDYSLVSVLQYRDRLAAYFSALEPMMRHFAQLTDDVSERVGYDYPAWVQTPIATSLAETAWLRYFLDNIFGAVTAVICVLGMLLVYALLLNDVDSRTYEYGMIRALGMEKRTLIQILLTKSTAFSVLGIALGLAAMAAANVPIEDAIAGFAALPPNYSVSTAAVLLGLGLGVAMPLVANVLPVRRALSNTLRDSLDLYHQVVSDVTVSMTRLENLGLSAWQTMLALFMVVAGFVIYYLVPYAFTFQNFPLFLAILMGVLMGFLVGLVILSMWLQPHGERLALKLLMSWTPHRRLEKVVRKNLAGHRPRNRKTALMFVLSVASVLFGATMLQLQSRTITDNIRVFFGADLVGFAPETDEALREEEMTAFLEREKQRQERGEAGAVVVDYTFVTFQLRDFDEVRWTSLRNLAQFPFGGGQGLYAVQENYMNVIYSDYYAPTETRTSPGGAPYPRAPGGAPDCVGMMFTDAGGALLPGEESAGGPVVPGRVATGGNPLAVNMTESYVEYVDLVVSEAMRPLWSMSLATPLDVRIVQYRPDIGERNEVHYMGKARGMVKKLPGFFFSSYQITARRSPAVLAEPAYLRLLNSAREFAASGPGSPPFPPLDRAPKQKVMVRVTAGATASEREDVLNGLRTLFVSDRTFAVDTRDTVAGTELAIDMLTLFFTVVGGIAMLLCFFMLWISFTSNVLHNGWEFGVLRSLGLSGVQCVSVYIYEALAIVLTALMLGAAIGVAVAVTLQLQFNLFVELPFQFVFPHLAFWSMTAMSLAVSVAGSLIPARSFMRKPISDVLRRT